MPTFKQLITACFCCGLLLAGSAQAQDADSKIQVDFQFRPRLELRDGAFTPLAKGVNPAALISDRTRLNVKYQYKDLLEIKISPQSVGIWGQATMVQGAEKSGNHVALYETWAKLTLGSHWHLQLGRQEISLDDERFFGKLDWAQGGRAHDALAISYKIPLFHLKGLFAYNQNYNAVFGNNLSNPSGTYFSPIDAQPYKWMQTLWAKASLSQASKISFLATNLGFQHFDPQASRQPVYFNQTFGANYFLKTDKTKAQLSGYLQIGANALGRETNAFMGSAQLGFNLNKLLFLGVGSDYLSGNPYGQASSKNHAFNPYFHTGHKFYGSMDYFYSGNQHQEVGLSDNYLQLNYQQKKYGLHLALHQFFAPAEIYNTLEKMSHNLGQEVDLSADFKINKVVGLSGGYSFFLNTPTLNFVKNVAFPGAYQQWAWVSLNIHPTFFKTQFSNY